MNGPVAGQHDARDACALGGAKNRAQVPGVGHAVQRDQKRRGVVWAVRPTQVVQFDRLKFGGASDHALRGLGAAFRIEHALRYLAHQDPSVPGQRNDVVDDVRLIHIAGDVDLLNLAFTGDQ